MPALLLMAGSALAIPAATLVAGSATARVAVIAPPWYGPTQVAGLVARAGGRILDKGGLGNVMIAVSDQPDFVAALRREGAWLTLDAGAVGGCLTF